MFLLPILLVIPIVWIIVSNNKRRQASQYDGRQAIDIAKERYARGEINKEQYEQIKKDLS